MDDKTKNILNTMKAFSNVSQIPVTLPDENGEPACRRKNSAASSLPVTTAAANALRPLPQQRRQAKRSHST